MLVAIDGIRKPDGTIGMNDDIIRGVEGAAMVVVEESGGFVRAFSFHVNQTGGLAERALGTEDDAVTVVGTAIHHVITLWAADLVASEVGG